MSSLLLISLSGRLSAMTPEEKNAPVQKIKVDFFKIARAHDSLRRGFEQDAKEPVAKWHGLTVGSFSKHLTSQNVPRAAFEIAAKMYGYYSEVIYPNKVTRINDLPLEFTDKDKEVIRSLNEVEFDTVKKAMPVEGLFLADIAQDRVDKFCQEAISDCQECKQARENLKNLHDFFHSMDKIRRQRVLEEQK